MFIIVSQGVVNGKSKANKRQKTTTSDESKEMPNIKSQNKPKLPKPAQSTEPTQDSELNKVFKKLIEYRQAMNSNGESANYNKTLINSAQYNQGLPYNSLNLNQMNSSIMLQNLLASLNHLNEFSVMSSIANATSGKKPIVKSDNTKSLFPAQTGDQTQKFFPNNPINAII